MCRFIPAGAGNTVLTPCSSIVASVYPRWRGEHVGLNIISISKNGLSPLARGTRSPGRDITDHKWFIPAGAGNTAGRVVITMPDLGLSPLARRTPDQLSDQQSALRFIPAGAGNTSTRRATSCFKTVYPRWRGEHSKAIHLYYIDFFAIKKTTNFSIFLKNANLLIINGQKRD